MPKYKKQFDGRGIEFSKKSAAIYAADFYDELFSLLMNAVKIKNLTFADEYFVKRELFEKGQIGYYDDLFYRVLPENIDKITGLPNAAQFIYRNGIGLKIDEISYSKDSDAARFIIATPARTPLINYIKRVANILGIATASIRQNLKATMTPAIYVTNDDNMRLTVEYAVNEKEDGESAVIVNAATGAVLKGVKCETEYIADKVFDLRGRIYKEALKRLGVPNSSNKREREQTAEIYADIADTVDSIYTLVDTWNAQIRDYSLPYEMELNGILPDVEASFIENGGDED